MPTHTVAALRAKGVRVAMLSGDGAGPVAAIAGALDIREAHGGLSPGDKTDLLDQWRDRGPQGRLRRRRDQRRPRAGRRRCGHRAWHRHRRGHRGRRRRAVSGSPSAVLTAREVSRRTLRNIVQNLVWAFGYNVALIPVAAGLLAIFGGPLLNPMLAAGDGGKLRSRRGQRPASEGVRAA
jgi:Cu+-exporting ATPase